MFNNIKKIKSLFVDIVVLAGLFVSLSGVHDIHPPSARIIGGLALVALVTTPRKKGK